MPTTQQDEPSLYQLLEKVLYDVQSHGGLSSKRVDLVYRSVLLAVRRKHLEDLTAAHAIWREECLAMLEDEDLIDKQFRHLTKSLDTVELSIAVDALRAYQRDIIKAFSLHEEDDHKGGA